MNYPSQTNNFCHSPSLNRCHPVDLINSHMDQFFHWIVTTFDEKPPWQIFSWQTNSDTTKRQTQVRAWWCWWSIFAWTLPFWPCDSAHNCAPTHSRSGANQVHAVRKWQLFVCWCSLDMYTYIRGGNGARERAAEANRSKVAGRLWNATQEPNSSPCVFHCERLCE